MRENVEREKGFEPSTSTLAKGRAPPRRAKNAAKLLSELTKGEHSRAPPTTVGRCENGVIEASRLLSERAAVGGFRRLSRRATSSFTALDRRGYAPLGAR
jgi:hypothetical protein